MGSRTVTYGKYELVQRINVGGMAEVFKARMVGSDASGQYVAIKRILPSIAEDRDFINMFIDEAKLSVQLKHPHIAHTYELGKSNDTYYIAMEYVPGKDLRTVFERLRRRGRAVPADLAAYVLCCAASGLDYAHRKTDPEGHPLGLVHRDVTPQNVLLSFDGDVKIIDFGIAKAENKIQRTQVGILKGKFGYMSPEQVAGKPIDRRSDLFSLGVVLYELLAGERLFVGTNDQSVLEKVRNTEIPPLAELRPEVPPALDQIVSHALTRNPADRYQHASEIETDLRNYLNAQSSRFGKEDLASFMRTTLAEDFEHESRNATPEPIVPDEPDWPRPQPSVSVPKIRATLLQHDLRPQLEGAVPAASLHVESMFAPPPDAEVMRSARMSLAALAQDTDPSLHLQPPSGLPVEGQQAEAQGASQVPLWSEDPDAGSLRVVWPVTAPPEAPATDFPPAPSVAQASQKLSEQPAAGPSPAETNVQVDSDATALRRSEFVPPEEHTRVAPVPPETFRPGPEPSREVTNAAPIRIGRGRKRTRIPWAELGVVALVLAAIAYIGVKWWWPNIHARDGAPSKLDLFAADGFGTLEVKTDPIDAQLLIDHIVVKPGGMEPFQSTHMDADVTHTLLARKEGYHEATATVRIPRGESKVVTLTLLPADAVLLVRTQPPNADIYVDDQLEGHSGESIGDVTPGKHMLRVEHECYATVQQPITMTPAGLDLDVKLQQVVGACAIQPGDRVTSFGTLRLYSSPTGHVFIDGHDAGETPLLDVRLSPGHHSVRVVSEVGAKDLDVDIPPGRAVSQTVMFEGVRP